MEPVRNVIRIVVISTLMIIVVVVLFMLYKKRRNEDIETPQPSTNGSLHAYSLSEIDAATDGFNQQRIINKGRLATVYAGMFATSSTSHNGSISTTHQMSSFVAIKRVHPRLVWMNTSRLTFSSVIKSLSLATHPNIVRILGYSEGPGERIVVMEFIGSENLDFFLHQNVDGVTLIDWDKRLKIAAGSARGIKYLHDEISPSIIHGSIKTSNIIIGKELCPKLCDYGLHFLAPNETEGLKGYVDDEYLVKGASKEADMYGFGVVLLEILSGRICEEGMLVKWAMPLIREGRINEVLDPRLEAPSNVNPLIRLAKVALACVANSRKHRPLISQVTTILNDLEMVPTQ